MAPKPDRSGWKTGDQLEFLLSHWGSFKRAQDAKGLNRFWAKIFEDWYDRWPVPSSPSLVREYGSIEATRLMLQKEKNTVRDDFYPFALITLTQCLSSK